jgi:hypothetical protein
LLRGCEEPAWVRVTREFARYIFDNVGVQEDIRDKGSTPRAGDDFFMARKSSIRNRIYCTPQNSLSS